MHLIAFCIFNLQRDLPWWSNAARVTHHQPLLEVTGGAPSPVVVQTSPLGLPVTDADDVIVTGPPYCAALRRNSSFTQLLHAFIKLSPSGGEERALLKGLSNHATARGVACEDKQMPLN